MKEFSAILISVFFGLSSAGAQTPILRNQSDNDAKQQRQFEIQFQFIADKIKIIWDSEIVPAVKLSYPDANIDIMKNFNFVSPSDPCKYKINIDPSQRRFDVPLSRNYIYILYSYLQPLLFHVIGVPEFTDAQKIVAYTMKRMDGQVDEFQKACLARAEEFFFANPSAEIFASEQKYIQAQSQLPQNPQFASVADEMAALSIIFVMLHEFGHVYYGHTGDYTIEQEREADQFARKVFEKSEIPTGFGSLGLLALRRNVVERSRERDLMCRLTDLLSDAATAQGRASELMQMRKGALRFRNIMQKLQQEVKLGCDS